MLSDHISSFGAVKYRKVTGREVSALKIVCIHVSSQLTMLIASKYLTTVVTHQLTARETLIRMNLWAYKYILSLLQEPLSTSWSLQCREPPNLPWPQTTLNKNHTPSTALMCWIFLMEQGGKKSPPNLTNTTSLYFFAFFTRNWPKIVKIQLNFWK